MQKNVLEIIKQKPSSCSLKNEQRKVFIVINAIQFYLSVYGGKHGRNIYCLLYKSGQLSGGQKKRAALAKTLLRPADILILDEPTNHLDTKMADWLEDYLRRYRGAMIMVTPVSYTHLE